LRADFHQLQRARDVMETRFAGVASTRTLEDLARMAAEQPDLAWFLVTDGDRASGFVTKEAALTPLCQLREAVTMGDIADNRFVTVAEETTLFDVMDLMRLGKVVVAVVSDNPASLSAGNVKGLLTQHQIGATMAQAVELYSDHTE
jgi:CBS domain containing-hemolysin-like protein